MGSILCCLRSVDEDSGYFFCLPWPIVNNNNNSRATAPQRADTRVAPEQERFTLAGSTDSGQTLAGSTDSGQADSMNTFRCPPRPLPYNDPQCSHHIEQHQLVTGHDKASTQFQKSNQLGESKNDGTRSTRKADRAGGSSIKVHSGGQKNCGTQVYVPSGSEDDCPICLEEYDFENPEIALQCNHHYHLSCIYEWMERSHTCPVCAKVMLFNNNE